MSSTTPRTNPTAPSAAAPPSRAVLLAPSSRPTATRAAVNVDAGNELVGRRVVGVVPDGPVPPDRFGLSLTSGGVVVTV
jgi:hypothetical protein